MTPFELRTERLVLDQPSGADVDAITEYCQDPLFERFLTTPWPYRRADAEFFVHDFVPTGWASDRELTWALRLAGERELLGVLGFRAARADLGYWLGAPHRGRGYMPEAVRAVTTWALSAGHFRIGWECVVGNVASAAVARKAGFAYTGEAPSTASFRDGSRPLSWHGVLATTPIPDALPWPIP